MDEKTCFRCSILKPLSEYYTHPQMADGHLNKCKACTRKDTEQRRARLSLDPKWLEAEHERHREKARRYRMQGKNIPTKEEKRQRLRAARAAHPQKAAARHKLSNAIRDGKIIRQPCIICGDHNSQGHHEDYSKPLDVLWLCVTHHNQLHNQQRRAVRLLRIQAKTKAMSDTTTKPLLHNSR